MGNTRYLSTVLYNLWGNSNSGHNTRTLRAALRFRNHTQTMIFFPNWRRLLGWQITVFETINERVSLTSGSPGPCCTLNMKLRRHCQISNFAHHCPSFTKTVLHGFTHNPRVCIFRLFLRLTRKIFRQLQKLQRKNTFLINLKNNLYRAEKISL